MGKDVQLVKVDSATPDPARAKSLDVIFIHGLTGDHEKTWKPPSGDTWTKRVANAHPDVQVWSLSYPAEVIALWNFGGMDQPNIQGLAVLAADRMLTHHIGERPCIFVCHSLGGLIVKRMLLDAWPIRSDHPLRFRHENVKAIMFCGTPHRGAELADVLNSIGAFLPSTALIDELRNHNVDLQRLNEDFGRYYHDRAQQGLLVKVYAETVRQRVAGIPTAQVVSGESVDPYLRVGHGPPLTPIPVIGKDHIGLVKPTSESDWVVMGLEHLIWCVREKRLDLDLEDPLQQRVYMLIRSEFYTRPELLDLSFFRRLASDQHDSAIAPLHVARYLASAEGEGVIESLGELTQAFYEVARGDRLAAQLHDGLTRIGCTLLLAYMRVNATRSPASQQVLEISVPAIGDSEQFDIMVEVLHASLRHWPVNLKLSEDRTGLKAGSWVLGPGGQSPKNWKDADHLHHLVNRITVAKAVESDALRGTHSVSWPCMEAEKIGEVDEGRLEEARGSLTMLLYDKVGLVLHALGDESPYAGQEMRQRINHAFGDLVALVLPASEELPAETLRKLSFLKGFAQRFIFKAETTRP